jgi:hypothetical protein
MAHRSVVNLWINPNAKYKIQCKQRITQKYSSIVLQIFYLPKYVTGKQKSSCELRKYLLPCKVFKTSKFKII